MSFKMEASFKREVEKCIIIEFRDGTAKLYRESEWGDYSYDGDTFIIKDTKGAWIAFINMEEVKAIYVEDVDVSTAEFLERDPALPFGFPVELMDDTEDDDDDYCPCCDEDGMVGGEGVDYDCPECPVDGGGECTSVGCPCIGKCPCDNDNREEAGNPPEAKKDVDLKKAFDDEDNKKSENLDYPDKVKVRTQVVIVNKRRPS